MQIARVSLDDLRESGGGASVGTSVSGSTSAPGGAPPNDPRTIERLVLQAVIEPDWTPDRRVRMDKKRVLFLCTHNSARSQMAEALLRVMAGDRFDVASAGTEATTVNPLTVRVMSEVGLDLRGHWSKTLDRFVDETWDYVVTVCDSANESCPVFPRAGRRLHWSFPDPSQASGSDEQKLAAFRDAREAIRMRLEDWLRGR